MLTSGAAIAQQAAHTGFYVGADAGRSTLGDHDFGDQESLVSRDDTDESFRLSAGYRFSRYFALETGIADLGSFDAEVALVCIALVGVDCSQSVSTSVDGAFVNAIGSLPLGKHVYLSATLGAFHYRSETRVALDTTSIPGRARDSGTVVQFGLGGGFPINDRFTITLDWQHAEDVSIHPWPVLPDLRDDADLSTLTAGVRFRF